MNTTYCHLTREQGECTIELGILGYDGIRRGAMADMDLFAAFGVELPNEEKTELWEVKEIRDRTVINRRAEKVANVKRTAEELRIQYDAALELRAADGLGDDDEPENNYYSPFDNG